MNYPIKIKQESNDAVPQKKKERLCLKTLHVLKMTELRAYFENR